MTSARCPSCGRPFGAGEVAGLGILRSRPERDGGPLMEFSCPRCNARMRLIVYGHGRYALPGEPPPPPVPEAERVPPWVGRAGAATAAGSAAAPPPPEPPPTPPPPEPPPPPPPGPGSPAEEAADPPLTVPEALEILGVEPTAGGPEIARAFREKSRLCHPDKVAHLDPEFQALAERKFKRLKGAFDLLSG